MEIENLENRVMDRQLLIDLLAKEEVESLTFKQLVEKASQSAERYARIQEYTSFSQMLNRWQCRFMHAEQRLQGELIRSDSIFTVYGKAIHNGADKIVHKLQAWWKKEKTSEREFVSTKEFRKIVRDFEDEFVSSMFAEQPCGKSLFAQIERTKLIPGKPERTVEEFLEYGRESLAAIPDFVLRKYGRNYEVIATEMEIFDKIPCLQLPEDHEDKFMFKGYVDLVLKDSWGKIHVADWKTCAFYWKREKSQTDVRHQLNLYRYFVGKKLGIPVREIQTEWIFLPRSCPDEPMLKPNQTENSVEWETYLALSKVRAEVYSILDGKNQKTEDPMNCSKRMEYFPCELLNSGKCSGCQEKSDAFVESICPIESVQKSLPLEESTEGDEDYLDFGASLM